MALLQFLIQVQGWIQGSLSAALSGFAASRDWTLLVAMLPMGVAAHRRSMPQGELPSFCYLGDYSPLTATPLANDVVLFTDRTWRACQVAVLTVILLVSAFHQGSRSHVRFDHHGFSLAVSNSASIQGHGHSHDQNLGGFEAPADGPVTTSDRDGGHHHVDAHVAWPPARANLERVSEHVPLSEETLTAWAIYPPDRPPSLLPRS